MFSLVNLVDTVPTLETTMVQLSKENNAELAKLVKEQCIANDTTRDGKCALIEQLARL